MLSNLITNALQAVGEGGLIRVSASRGAKSEDVTILRVEDNGMGIPTDKLATIFEDFVTTKRKGLGLGLAISKKIVELHGGTIRVQSKAGEGAAFEVEIPKRPAG